MATRTVFFDFGGTLAVPITDMRPLFEVAARRVGLTVPWDAFLQENDRVWQELWPTAPGCLGRRPAFADRVHEEALRRAGAKGPIRAMVRAVRREAVSARWHPPYPETEGVLEELRARGYGLHVLSNHVDYLPLVLRGLGWSDLFDGVTFSQEIGAQKPDPRLFRFALERAGCPAGDAVHVGDSWDADYVGARNAGLRAIWLRRDGRLGPPAAEEIRDLRGLLELLPRIGTRAAAGPGARPRPRRPARTEGSLGPSPRDAGTVRRWRRSADRPARSPRA